MLVWGLVNEPLGAMVKFLGPAGRGELHCEQEFGVRLMGQSPAPPLTLGNLLELCVLTYPPVKWGR